MMRWPTAGLGRKILRALGWSLVIGLLLLAGCRRSLSGGPVSSGSGPTPADLRPGYQEIYLDLVARAYEADPALDLKLALGPGWTREKLQSVLQAMLDKTPRSETARIARLQNLAKALETQTFSSTGVQVGVKTAGGSNSLLLTLTFFVLLIVITFGYVWVSPLVQGLFPKPPQAVAVRTAQASRPVEPTLWAGVPEKPQAQFVATYEIGDDHYNTSFSIETPTGEFLGECGAGVSETIGAERPSRVTAFEVWLFDKNDIRTVTKFLVSEFAYHDEALRTRLATKAAGKLPGFLSGLGASPQARPLSQNDVALARPGAILELDTTALKVRARVVEMDYGTGELEPRSFFNKLTLELAAWPKRKP